MEPLDSDGLRWWVDEPDLLRPDPGEHPGVKAADVAELDALDPPPKSQRDVMSRLGWGAVRAMAVLRAWRQMRAAESAPDDDEDE